VGRGSMMSEYMVGAKVSGLSASANLLLFELPVRPWEPAVVARLY
jgi:hypothetical protein